MTKDREVRRLTVTLEDQAATLSDLRRFLALMEELQAIGLQVYLQGQLQAVVRPTPKPEEETVT